MTDQSETNVTTVRGIKGFDKNLCCLGYQFALGEKFKHEGRVKACASGFHAVTDNPILVLGFYPPATSRYAYVEQSGALSTEGEKTASEILKVGREEVGLSQLINDAVAWVMARATPEGETATGDGGAASSTGYRGAASSTGYRGAASSTGDGGAASSTGDGGAASSTGDGGAASSTGDGGAALSTGNRGAASSTGYRGAASSTGDGGAASSTGDGGAASSTGDGGAASSTGYRGAASSTGDGGAASSTGYGGAAMASGANGRVMGADGNALFAVERGAWDGKGYPIISVASGIVGREGIKPNVWYAARDGRLVEVGAGD